MAEQYWACIGNGEVFNEGPEPTRALLFDRLMQECPAGQHFQTGRRADIALSDYCPPPDLILEHVAERLADNCGEAANDWWPSSTDEEALGQAIKAVFLAWCLSSDASPTFFQVVDIETHAAQ